MKYFISVISCLLICQMGYADIKTLVLPGQDWDDPSTWSPFGVPTANDSVFVTNLVVIPADVTAIAEYVELSSDGWLQIRQDIPNNMRGVLLISDAPSIALKSDGLIENQGRITITNAVDTGFVNNGWMHLSANSRLGIVNTINDQPIYNNGKIENNGVIDVSIARLGIVNRDSIVNLSGGIITIDNVSLVVSYNISSTHLLINDGEITISNTSGRGIENNILLNTGDIIISGTSDIGIVTWDSIFNSSEGSITVKNINGSGIVVNGGSVNNQGDITIRNVDTWSMFLGPVTVYNNGKIKIIGGATTGIYNFGNFINQDTISIRNHDGSGLVNEERFDNFGSFLIDSAIGAYGIENLDTFINHAHATLVLRDIEISNKGTIYNQLDAYLENAGRVVIDDNNFTSHGIYNDGLLVNLDTISMSGIEDGITNNDSLVNGVNGVIQIMKPLTVGLYNFGGLQNDGRIDINQTFVAGLSNVANFWNGTTGTLSIANTSPGIFNQATIQNDGMIIVDSCSSIAVNSFGPIINRDSIIVSNSLDYGVELVQGHYFNSGYFSIQNVEDGNGLLVELQAVLDITSGGQFLISNVMNASLMSLINLGVITISSNSLMKIFASAAVPMDLKLGSTLSCYGACTVDY